jgi:hypothetical protein
MPLSTEREIVTLAENLHPFVQPYCCGNWYRAPAVRQASLLVHLTDWQ